MASNGRQCLLNDGRDRVVVTTQVWSTLDEEGRAAAAVSEGEAFRVVSGMILVLVLFLVLFLFLWGLSLITDIPFPFYRVTAPTTAAPFRSWGRKPQTRLGRSSGIRRPAG